MAENKWIDQQAIKASLATFFESNNREISTFGLTVNQTFEAFVFAAVIGWYRESKWEVEFRHPRSADDKTSGVRKQLRLKFSTRGRPGNYSYAVCKKGNSEVHIRHQLRVATHFHEDSLQQSANVCLDVAVIKPISLESFSTHQHVPNSFLITFGEAKHMSAFAELMANFIGLVHEMQPRRLNAIRKASAGRARTLSPFLYVSGFLFPSAMGIEESIKRRQYDVDFYCNTRDLAKACKLPLMDPRPSAKAKSKTKTRKRAAEDDFADLPF